MAPRIPAATTRSSSTFNLTSLLTALSHPEATTKCSSCIRTFTSTPATAMKRGGKKKPNQRKDPYRLAQAAQRKTANLEKRAQLAKERRLALGSPLRSTPTPFLTSLNLQAGAPGAEYLNYQLDPKAAATQLAHSKWLTAPLRDNGTPSDDARVNAEYEGQHKNAETAISSITSLANSNSKDRTRINVQRCIETFGRHTTDSLLPPKPTSHGLSGQSLSSTPSDPLDAEKQSLLADLAALPKRIGPDTGSSEVQIAILTTKIAVLADTTKKGDKHNRRALTLLVHRRAKLLKYLRRRERGGPRWMNLVKELGINDAMWRGEISPHQVTEAI